MDLLSPVDASDVRVVTSYLRDLRIRTRELVQLEDPGAGDSKVLLRYEYRRLTPSTDDPQAVLLYLEQLRKDLLAIREEQGRGSGYGHDAYMELHTEAIRYGRRLDSLPEYSRDDRERFFANVVHGTDGHAYWKGGQTFRTYNNGSGVKQPRRWWWEHEKGTKLPHNTVVWSECGEKHCIAPNHCAAGHHGKQKWSDDVMIGKLQVIAMRWGKSPLQVEWDREHLQPASSVYKYRFGNWTKALLAAGLEPREQGFTDEDCLTAIRFLRHELGRWPTWTDFQNSRELLRAKGLPANHRTIMEHHGQWTVARERARSTMPLPVVDAKVPPGGSGRAVG